MPVIPSFTGFAATPNLATAYLGGARIAQADRQQAAQIQLQRERMSQEAQSDAARLAQAAASDAQRIQIARETLAARQVEGEMELQAKQKLYDQQALQKNHEAQIEKAYRDMQIGLQERRLQGAEKVNKIRLETAAREFEQQQSYDRVRQQNLASGMDERQASEAAMRQVGFGASGFSKAFSGANQPPPMPPEIKSELRDLEGRISRTHAAWLKADEDEKAPFARSLRTMQAQKEQLFEQLKPRQLVPPTMTATNPPAINEPMRGLSIPSDLNSSQTNAAIKILNIRRR
jgi:hypothetical protein